MTCLSAIQQLEPRVLFSVISTINNLTTYGDLNGDQFADQVIVHRNLAARNVTVEIDLGKGNGVFVRSDSATLSNFTPTAVTVGDVNGDGAADVVVAGFGSAGRLPTPLMRPTAAQDEVIVLLGNGKGGFVKTSAVGQPAQHVYKIPHNLLATSVAVGDMDGDGSADIAVLGQAPAPTTTTASVVTRQTAIDVLWDPTRPAPASVIPTQPDTFVVPAGNPNVDMLLSGDLDANGRTDLVAAASRQNNFIVTPLRNTADTNVPVLPPIRPDLVTVAFPTDRTAVVTVGTNPLDGAVPLGTSGTSGPIVRGISREATIGLGDLHNNGQLDLVGLLGNNIVYSAYNSSTGAFGAAQMAQSENPPANLLTSQIYLADINGDQLPDLLAQTSSGVYLGRNTATSSANAVLFSWTRVALPPIINPPQPIGPHPLSTGLMGRLVLA